MVNEARNAPGGDSQPDRFEGSSAAPLPLTPSEDRQWAMIAHFGAILGCIPSLIIYAVFRARGPFTAQESKEALNFTFPLTVLAIVLHLFSLIPAIGWIFAIMVVAIWLFLTISGVRAGINANKSRPYRYGLNLRLFR